METNAERGRRLGRKYVLAGFVTLASTFVALTTVEITLGVFGPGLRVEVGAAAPVQVEGACSKELRGLADAVERAIVAAARVSDEARAAIQYREALLPEWVTEGAIEARCANEAGGSDALAVVLRLRLAGEELARRQAGELGPIRRELEAHLGH